MIGTLVAEDQESLEQRLEREIASLRLELKMREDMLSIVRRSKPSPTSYYSGLKPHEAAKQYISEHGPSTYGDIAKALIDGGAMQGKSHQEEQVFKALDYQVKAGGLRLKGGKAPLMGKTPRDAKQAQEFTARRRAQVVDLT